MILHLEHHQIDKQKWDACIEQAPNGLIYAFSWYLDTVCSDWEALVVGDYELVMPLVHRRKMGVSVIYQSFTTQQLGVFSQEPVPNEIVVAFLKAIPEKYKLIEVKLNSFNSVESETLEVVQNLNFELDLNFPYDALRSGYSSNTKRNVKKGEKNGVQITSGTNNFEQVIQLFRENKGNELEILGPDYYQLLTALFGKAMQRGHGEVWLGHHEGQLVCGALFLKAMGRMIFLLSATTPGSKQVGGMPFLLDSVIRQYAGQPVIFDFEGSNDPNLARFNRSFGSKESVYLLVRENRLPGIFKWFTKG